jgi:CDGSH-type Zn-finger protein
MTDKPQIAQECPYVMQLEPGKYAWCACGHSRTQPFCDGSHKETSMTPIVFEIEEEKKYALCGCKHNQGADPFCDGSHSKL